MLLVPPNPGQGSRGPNGALPAAGVVKKVALPEPRREKFASRTGNKVTCRCLVCAVCRTRQRTRAWRARMRNEAVPAAEKRVRWPDLEEALEDLRPHCALDFSRPRRVLQMNTGGRAKAGGGWRVLPKVTGESRAGL